MKLKYWDWINKKLVDSKHSLFHLLTVQQKCILIQMPKPKDKWGKADKFHARHGMTPGYNVAVNFGGVGDITYLRDPETDEGWYLQTNKDSTTFVKLFVKFRGFTNLDKTSGNQYVFEGTFKEFLQTLEKEGFTFDNEDKRTPFQPKGKK